ncbi:MAG TPA: alpha-L-fucosidase [Phycisphaerae bacterium]|nr:alpha-L-fucosidase [Phycisphaerae bacterium]
MQTFGSTARVALLVCTLGMSSTLLTAGATQAEVSQPPIGNVHRAISQSTDAPRQTGEQSLDDDARLKWWREARFGLFIHWGLYSIPAGDWGNRTDHGEWIRQSARIPIDEYDTLLGRFNPQRFDADAWARLAKDAGMRYIVITSKHHDGFCLFDSALTDYDVMSTPFQRDVMKELSEACRRADVRMCWYHSIMDWRHPDYLPRRDWEDRPATDADFERYAQYLRGQVRELLTNYGPIGVMWFDGEWESTWSHERGLDLYHFVRTIQPNVIVNNRVDKGRSGMAGMTSDARFAGDFGTPEQEIPATGLPGVDWETCMTMNDHWGFNQRDSHWKSTADLIHTLVDVVSKGGNFLLNVGPTADGAFPQPCVDRLRGIGRWMKVNSDSIHGTSASPFRSLPWGRCTQRSLDDGTTRLYLHVFDWPADRRLVVPGIYNEPIRANLLADNSGAPLELSRSEDSIIIGLPGKAPDTIDSVIVLDVKGPPDINHPPVITAAAPIFTDSTEVRIHSDRVGVQIRYTLDDTIPTSESPRVDGPIQLDRTATVRARVFRGERPVSKTAAETFERVTPRPAADLNEQTPGLQYEVYEGAWDAMPSFDALTPMKVGHVAGIDLSVRDRPEAIAIRFTGAVTIPRDGVYRFFVASDDGSRLYIDGDLVVDNDGLHGMREASGFVALAAGPHPITVCYFNRTGDLGLDVLYEGPGVEKQRLPTTSLTCDPNALRPRPTPRQLAWQQVELQAFVHFGINTFTDREWGDGTESPALFNPTELDARQWISTLGRAGMNQVILSARHHDGFCLWPSRYTEHSVKHSPWRDGHGDLVREVSEACRELGLRFGIYLSPWDRHEPSYGTDAYNDYYVNQLTELLTNYGPIHEVWFDGACGEGPNGRKQVYDWPRYIEVVRRLQPDAVIFSDAGPDVRWVGNENGFADETNWSTLRRNEFRPGGPNYRELTHGHADGAYWTPAECDVSIRPGWFYHAAEDDKVKSLSELLDIYDKSVGRNGVLLLNVPPDRRGLIHENDARRLAEFRDAIEATFRDNLALGKHVVPGPDELDAAQDRRSAIVDGDLKTAWTPQMASGPASIVIDLLADRSFDLIAIREDIRSGQRVSGFHVDVEERDGAWKRVAEGTTIGYQRLLRIPPMRAQRLRLTITSALGRPAIAEFGLYRSRSHD